MLKRCSKEKAVREYEGYKWFGVETELTPDGILIPEFKGKVFPFYNGIDGNEIYIKQLIRFYKQEWNKRKFAIHGDLCLCNVIISNDKLWLHIIDWEHFHYADKRYFGFDIINMLFIHLQYQYRWWSYWGWNWVSFVKQKHKYFIRETVEMLGRTKFLEEPFHNASEYIKKYMDKDKFILGKQKEDRLVSLDLICQ